MLHKLHARQEEMTGPLQILIAFLILRVFEFVFMSSSDVIVYSNHFGYHLHAGLIQNIPCPGELSSCTKTHCVARCRCEERCTVINYNNATGQCQLHDTTAIYSPHFDSGDDDWMVMAPQEGPPEFGEWKLVFRATSGINISVYDTYYNTSRIDDIGFNPDIADECATLDGSLPCGRHFRSAYLDTWEERNISQVHYAMYRGGEMISSVTFDGTGSDVTSWFSASRIIDTAFDLLEPNTTFNYFSIAGDSTRRFFINRNYGGCSNDNGWMVVVDPRSSTCPWEGVADFPIFLTSNTSSDVNWNSNEDVIADVMAIMVKI